MIGKNSIHKFSAKLVLGLLLFIVGICTIGCGSNQTSEALLKADSMIETDPDSVLLILETIDFASLKKGRELALYGLLYTQGRIKKNIRLESDSLVSYSVKYFKEANDSVFWCRSLFYKAIVNFIGKNYIESMYYARAAYELSHQLKNHLYIARSAELIADNYQWKIDKAHSTVYYQEAADEYEKAGKHLNHLFSLCDLAIADYSKHRDRSVALLDSIIIVADSISNTDLRGYAMDNMINYWVLTRDLENFNKYIEFDRKYDFLSDRKSLMLNYARLHIFLGNHKKAREIMDSLPPLKRGSYKRSVMYWNRIFMDQAEHNDKMLIADLESLLINEGERFDLTFKNSIYEADKKYYSDQAAMARIIAENTKYRYSLIIVSIVLIILIAGIVAWKFVYSTIQSLQSKYRKYKDKNEENERTLSKYEQTLSALHGDVSLLQNLLQTSLQTNSEEKSRHESEVREMYRSNWRTITELCEFYYESKLSGKAMPRAMLTFEKKLKSLIDEKNLQCLQKAIDSQMGNVISEHISNIETVTEPELLLYAFLAAGFSTDSIAFYFKINMHALYKRRIRLIEKIKNSDLPDKEKLIDMINLKV